MSILQVTHSWVIEMQCQDFRVQQENDMANRDSKATPFCCFVVFIYIICSIGVTIFLFYQDFILKLLYFEGLLMPYDVSVHSRASLVFNNIFVGFFINSVLVYDSGYFSTHGVITGYLAINE